MPREAAQATDTVTSIVDTESHPWSNNSPIGEEEFVRRACFPSIASSVWYTNRPKAQATKT